MISILAVVLIVVGIILFLVGIGMATNVPLGGRTENLALEIVFITLGLGCLGYGGICLHDDRQDKKLEEEEEKE